MASPSLADIATAYVGRSGRILGAHGNMRVTVPIPIPQFALALSRISPFRINTHVLAGDTDDLGWVATETKSRPRTKQSNFGSSSRS